MLSDSQLARSKNPSAEKKGLSWYKEGADRYIEKMWEIHTILIKYDVVFDIFYTDNPGYLVYEDEYQVSAVPFNQDSKLWK